MAIFTIRYDLRCPEWGPRTSADLAAAAIEQCEWADRNGFLSVTLSEHHGSPDGYLPSPMVLAGAVAARTKSMRITFGALIAPLHNPIRLAEDLATLDVLSRGRIIPVVSGGYVESEFKDVRARAAPIASDMMDAHRSACSRSAWSGEPFEHNGTTVRVTPRPHQRPRPPIFMGGASRAAARRAAKPRGHASCRRCPKLWDVLPRGAASKLGKPDPGAPPKTTGNSRSSCTSRRIPDAAWQRIAPHAMHEMNAYGAWAAAVRCRTRAIEPDRRTPTRCAPPACTRSITPEEARGERAGRRWAAGGTVTLHPLMGGHRPRSRVGVPRADRRTKVMPALR